MGWWPSFRWVVSTPLKQQNMWDNHDNHPKISQNGMTNCKNFHHLPTHHQHLECKGAGRGPPRFARAVDPSLSPTHGRVYRVLKFQDISKNIRNQSRSHGWFPKFNHLGQSQSQIFNLQAQTFPGFMKSPPYRHPVQSFQRTSRLGCLGSISRQQAASSSKSWG